MEQQGQLAATSMIQSLTGWWELAGVDAAVGEVAVDWLALDAKADATENVAPSMPVGNEASPPTPSKPSVEWPLDIETLKAMIANGEALPGNGFSTISVAPVGPAKCEVMVISDLPDQDEANGKTLGTGATGALLTRMLAAISVDLSNCYWTALATTIPSTGEIPENVLNELAGFARYQIGLVNPQSVILLGSSACKALLGEELMRARQSLQNINHDGSNMAVLTTFHPRTLIARPAMKAQAWKDLQMFAKRAGL
jgi:uracil-DNA glycosylase